LTYVKLSGESNGDAGDQYTGLDRFGRVVDQRWIVTATGTALDRWQYGYDRDGNVLYSNNLVNSSFSELYHQNGSSYGYDNLNQLTNFARGVLSDTNSDGIPDTISSPSHSQSWSFDALGNWSSVNTDASNQTRTANQQNEITSISGQTTPGYDANGNTTTDQNGKTLVYDAWNRLVAYKNGATVLEAYSYDALNRRIKENPGTLRDIFFSKGWQVLEEDVAGSMADQYVWSSVYIDALVERDTPTLRMYVQQNANFDVTSLLDTSGNVQERYISDPYGSFTVLTSTWTIRGTSNYGWVIFHQGGRYDFATGLFAFRRRDYSPTLGRWMENDPIGFAAHDTDLYRLELGNPVDNTDPFGRANKPYQGVYQDWIAACCDNGVSDEIALGVIECWRKTPPILFGKETCQRWVFSFEAKVCKLQLKNCPGITDADVYIFKCNRWFGNTTAHCTYRVLFKNGQCFYFDNYDMGDGAGITKPSGVPSDFRPPDPAPVCKLPPVYYQELGRQACCALQTIR
jgi:RHS repeat-associated protein